MKVRRELLEAFLDSSECRFDHHGNCQEHDFTLDPGELCPQAELKEALLQDDRPRLLPSFWRTIGKPEALICDLCGALVPDVTPVPGSMPDARAAHRRWHANHPDYRPNCRFCGEPESVWCCDARMEAAEQGEG